MPIAFLLAAALAQWAGDAVTDQGRPSLPDPAPPAEPTVTTSSVLVEKGRPPSFYAGSQVLDGKLSTCWCEGKPDSGLGESLTVTLPKPARLAHLRVYPGCSETPRVYENNNRIKKLSIEAGGATWDASLPDERRLHELKLEVGAPVSTVRLVIRDVYRGKKYDDTCIAEVQLEQVQP